MLRVDGNGQQRLRRGLEQQVIDHCLVVPGDLGDRRRQGEDNMEIRDREQLGFPVRQPLARRRALTFGAVPVAAAAVLDLRILARIAAHDRAAQPGGAAGFDGRHHLELVEADMAGIGGAPCGAMIAEDVRDFESGAEHGQPERLLGVFSLLLGRLDLERRQLVERAGHRADRPRGDLGVDRGRF